MPLHVEKRYSNKSIARSFVGQWSISIQKALTHIQMCNSAGLLPHVAWGLLAQEMVTQRESSDRGGEAGHMVRELHSGKFWLDVKKAQGWLSSHVSSEKVMGLLPGRVSNSTEHGPRCSLSPDRTWMACPEVPPGLHCSLKYF